MATSNGAGDRRIRLTHVGSFELGGARVCPPLLQIHCGVETEMVEPRVMQMLVALHQAHGAPVSRDDLIEFCWGGLAVGDDAITQCISKLRRALNAVPDVQVDSVPRVGYRLNFLGQDGLPSLPTTGVSRRKILAGVSVGAAGVAGLVLFKRRIGASSNSIAVLPFVNFGNDPNEIYFSDGISEEIRNALARLDGLKVVGRTSSEALRNADATEVARQLHVSNVLIGSVRRSPALVRVAAQLIDGRTGFERWSQTFDLAVGDALQLQTDIAQGVALALSLTLGRAERLALVAGSTRNSTAYDLYLQAKQGFKLSDTEATFRKIIALCDAAIGIDQSFANAHALKGIAWDSIGSSFATDTRALAQAYWQGGNAGSRAIAIAPQVAAGYIALARSLSGRLNVRGALVQYQKAEHLAHGDPGIMNTWILTLAEIGRTVEALALAENLISLDPLNAAVFGMQSFALFFARQYDVAIRSARKSLSLAPGLTQQQSLIGDCLCLLGNYPQAAAEYAKVPDLDPYRMTGEAILAAHTGDLARSEQAIHRLQRSYGDPMSYQIAQIHAQRGELNEAFAALHRGWLALDPGLNGLQADPFIDPLRGDPRLLKLVESLNFP